MLETNQTSNQVPKQNTTIYLKDYQPPEFAIDAVELDFDLRQGTTRVTSRLRLKKIADVADLVLDGEGLALIEISLDGKALIEQDDYDYQNNQLTVKSVPQQFELQTIVDIEPEKNTQLSGLYQSSGNYCTQCEAEGFRRITFYLDRPDVLSVFTVTMSADKQSFPVLLANGNLQSSSDLADGRHQAVWHDPHPKPSYLFALVAGNLSKVSDNFTTQSGQPVELNVFAEAHNIDKCDHALRSLVKSMQWDEQVYGREYDLDVYNIVAVDDFNMGAMENKGLNVFNSKYVLALPDTATDTDFDGIESVIGHEYFHNWSGNRVTCRDWFQLSLKEGFTVFRDQEFSADMGSRGVKRIQDVDVLRTYQFKEDAGPMAHPVRPDSYQEINNFYTVTVYNKGAEVVRMLHNLLGAETFRAGTDLYFSRHDGQAVTTDDFAQAMQEVSGRDLSQFKLWYSQAGTPELTLSEHYANEIYTLTVRQSCPDTPNQTDKQAFHLPLKIALLDYEGVILLPETVIELTQSEQKYTFNGIKQKPVLSFLRGFSAPVKVEFAQADRDMDSLIKFDDDPFVRWEAMQKRLLAVLLEHYQADSDITQLPESMSAIFQAILTQPAADKAMVAELLALPSESYLADFCQPINPQKLRRVREQFGDCLAQEFESHWLALYEQNQGEEYVLSGVAAAQRQLKNLSLHYLLRLGKESYYELAVQQFRQADNMTDSIAAMTALVNSSYAEKANLLDEFYQQWSDNALVLDKWFILQSTAKVGDVFAEVKDLCGHPAFSMNNPNKVRSLLSAFAQNLGAFHRQDGLAYAFFVDKIIELDAKNPQIAARMVGVFNQWKTFESTYAGQMQKQLQRLNDLPDLSRDVREIVSKAL
ncbi:MAG: aminopeptidase N [Arenicella sp.]